MTPPLIAIVGPTGSGKSDLALEVARLFDGEIICADSRTVYKGMDVGTGKPTQRDQVLVPHHLLDIVRPDQSFTAADFQRTATKIIQDIWSRGKWPIIVGGTGLYVDSILFNYSFGRVASKNEREQRNAMPVEELQVELIKNDLPLPQNTNNKRHLVRALEMGGLLQQSRILRDNTLVVGITIDSSVLQMRLWQRAEKMVKRGVLEEARRLAKNYSWDCEPMKSNIYRVLRAVIEGEASFDNTTLEEVVAADRRLAKKQMTWLKRNHEIHWGTPEQGKKRILVFIDQMRRLYP